MKNVVKNLISKILSVSVLVLQVASISEAQLLQPAQKEATPAYLNFNLLQNNGEPLKPSDDVDLVALKEKIFPKPIRQVLVGVDQTCALDAYGVKCWGENKYGQANVPVLNKPVQVSAGDYHTCALDADGVKCWGGNNDGQTNVPVLNKPVQVSAGGFHTCALDADGVKCWGSNSDGQTNVPVLNKPVQASAGDYHTCALDAYGVKCWGSNHFGQTKVPVLNKPVQVSANWSHTCALDADGVKCWGYYNSEGQTHVLQSLQSNGADISPYNNVYLNGTYQSSTPVRAKYLLAMLNIAEQGQYIFGSKPRPTSYMLNSADSDEALKQKYTTLAANLDLLYQLQEPVIYSGDSDAYLGVLIPEYEKLKTALKKFIADNKINSAQMSDARSAYLVLYSMRSALDGMKDFLMPDDRAQITAQIQKIDLALKVISESKAVPSLNEVISGYTSLRAIISQLEQAPRAWFLPQASDRAYKILTN